MGDSIKRPTKKATKTVAADEWLGRRHPKEVFAQLRAEFAAKNAQETQPKPLQAAPAFSIHDHPGYFGTARSRAREALDTLCAIETNLRYIVIVDGITNWFVEKGFLSNKQAAVVSKRLDHYKIQYDPYDFAG